MIFLLSRRHTLHPLLYITFIQKQFKLHDQFKILSMVFNKKKITYIPHLVYLREKYSQVLKLVNVTANTEWSADQQTLLKLRPVG